MKDSFRLLFFLWYNDASTDKVWGIIDLADVTVHEWVPRHKFITFTARHGKPMKTQVWCGSKYEAEQLYFKKIDDGYKKVNAFTIDAVYPNFNEDIEKIVAWAILTHGEVNDGQI